MGKGSKAAKQDLYFSGNVRTFEFYGKNISLLFVDAYKHMGTKFSLTHDLHQEVATRAAIIRSGTRALKDVLRNPKFPLVKKLSYVKAHLFSSGFFQCSTWGPLSPSLYGKIHSSVVQV